MILAPMVLEAFNLRLEFHQIEHGRLRMPDTIDSLETERIAERVGESFALRARKCAKKPIFEERPHPVVNADDFVQPYWIEFTQGSRDGGVLDVSFDRTLLFRLQLYIVALPQTRGVAEIKPVRVVQ